MNAYLRTVVPSSIGMLNLGAPPVESPVESNETWTALSGLALRLLELMKTPPNWSAPLTMVALSPLTVTVPVPNAVSYTHLTLPTNREV